MASVAIGGMAALCGSLGGPGAAALAVVLLVLSLRRFFFPTRFAVDADGVIADSLFGAQRLAWSEVRRLAVDRHGAYLSTRSRPSRLDAFRGMHLLFGPARDEVVAALRAGMAERGCPVAVARTADGREADAPPATHPDSGASP